MTCIGGTGSNKSYIENFVEVLLALSKKYYDNLVNYMNAFVNESGFPSDKVGSFLCMTMILSAPHLIPKPYPSRFSKVFLQNS